jgi:hypothetical protein
MTWGNLTYSYWFWKRFFLLNKKFSKLFEENIQTLTIQKNADLAADLAEF